MKKWSLASSQKLPSKGMEKYMRIKNWDLNQFISAFGEDYSGYPRDLLEDLEYDIKDDKSTKKDNENESDEEEEENEQDYTLDNNSEISESDIEEINNLACNSPFLKTIKSFCLMEREGKIRKGESWKCQACNFSNFSSRLSCYKCQCWKWEKSSKVRNFPTFVPKDQMFKMIKSMKEKYRNLMNNGTLVSSKGPRYALIPSFIWNSTLKEEKAVELSFDSKRQVVRATQVFIRGGKEQESLPSVLRAKSFKTGPHSINSELSNHMSASHNELDSLKYLIKKKWWKSDENWLSNEDWTKLSVYERTMLRFKFSYSHLNLDAFTWSKFSFSEKNEFIRRKRRWIKEHMKGASEEQKKMMSFWKSRFRWKKKIWSIKDQKVKEAMNNSYSEL
jgi:hypothetical protein